MTVRETLINLFEENKGKFLSGEELAEISGCTREAVRKAVNSLRSDGYMIQAVSGRGYCFYENNDVISEDRVKKYLKNKSDISQLYIYKTTDSTNIRLKELAASGAPEGTVVISGEQTAGRGRLGRNFFSPSDSGLYMSILLRPHMSASEAVRITTAAAAATAESVEALSGCETGIKWVNDIYISGKKICGILTEASFGLEYGRLEYAVSGIGINVYEPDGGFSEEIKDIAGAVFYGRKSDMRNRLAAEVIGRFMKYYREIEQNTYLESYRKRLLWRGERINVISPSGTVPAVLTDVDDECRLIVKYEDGREGVVSTGEISIRKA